MYWLWLLEVRSNVGQVPTLAGQNAWFGFDQQKAESKPDLVDSKQELDLKLETKAKTRIMVLFMCGIGIIIKNLKIK